MKKIIKLFVMAALLMTGCRNNHEYVDLGLPSGTLWATCNVGATTPEGYGDYFAWGETKPKTDYNESTYKYCNGDVDQLTKYCNKSSYGNNGFTDNLTVLQPGDDAATANWGSDWCMPTLEQWKELLENTMNKLTTQNGVYGRLLTACNGNSLFLPAAAATGRVRFTRTIRTTRGTSTSIRATTTWTAASAATVYLCGLCVPRVRTNLCSVTGKTGKAQEQSGGALAEQAIQPRSAVSECARLLLKAGGGMSRYEQNRHAQPLARQKWRI